MTPDEFKLAIAEKMDEIQRYRDEDLPHVVGKEAVDHFQDSFVNEGFTDQAVGCDSLSKNCIFDLIYSAREYINNLNLVVIRFQKIVSLT